MKITWRAIALGFFVSMMSTAFADTSGQSLLEYGQMCAAEIGQIPAFDCNSGSNVPITVSGKVPTRYKPQMTCDRPALLPYGTHTFGQCTPYSKILNLSRGPLQISAFCRREFLRPANSPRYDEVDIILHSVDSGKTCWFHAEAAPGRRNGFNASRVPPPDEKTPPPGHPSAASFWWAPAATASKNCGGCHDADPFMYSPWLGQKWHLVPTDPLGHYSNIGADFSAWESSAISTPDNTCVGCHRIGNKASCSTYIALAAGMAKAPPGSNALAKNYPLNHWMPVDNNQSLRFWNQAHKKSVDDLLTCCKDPGNPICTLTSITPPPKKMLSGHQ